MIRTILLSLLTASALPSAIAQEVSAKVHAEPAPSQNADRKLEATYFIRPETKVPSNADMSRGDVPRDDYGRPFTYEYLGRELPAFDGILEDGDEFSSVSLEGHWTVIRVWGMWCHDSRGELQEAVELSERLAEVGDVKFISVHVPQNAQNAARALRGYESLSDFFAEAGYSYPTVIDSDARLRDTLKIRWTPSYILVAPDLSVQGFRTSLADAGDGSVERFVKNIALTQERWALTSSLERLPE